MTSTISCPACHEPLQSGFRFCPYCGRDLTEPLLCPRCRSPFEANQRFCHHCGAALQDLPNPEAGKATDHATQPKAEVVAAQAEPPPSSGVTIEFPYSSAQRFDFAVECATRFSAYRRFGSDKRATYRVTFTPADMDSALELAEHLKGWRRRTVYVDGERVPWDSVFAFACCYERKRASYKPGLYCFGYEAEWEFNIWGCIQTNMPFTEHGRWFCWGQWVNNRGDWRFDKEHIRHELEKTLYRVRFCPALQPGLISEALAALPDVVSPDKNKNWRFVESWGDENAPGLPVIVNRYGFKEKVVMSGVALGGQGALEEIAKRMKRRLPPVR